VETLAPVLLFTSGTVAAALVGVFFTINQVPDVASYSGIFDQYVIRMIECQIEPIISEVTSSAGDPGNYVSVVDIDDGNTPVDYAQLMAYPTAISTKGSSSHYHRWVPTIALATYSGAFTSFSSVSNMWVDMASPNVQHYGLKAVASPAVATQGYTITSRLHVSFRARH
jgi:hypothetical protein